MHGIFACGNKSAMIAIAGLDRPLGFQKVVDPRISRHSAYKGGKVVSHNPPPPRRYPWYPFLLEAESTPGRQCSRKD